MDHRLALSALALAACGAAARPRPLAARPDVCTPATAEAREQAVVRGLAWMADYLEDPARLEVLGMDATSIFLEVGETAKSPLLRGIAMPLARREAARMAQVFLREGGLDVHDDLMGAISLLADAELLQVPKQPLLGRVREKLATLATADDLYMIDLGHLDQASEDDLFWLLLDSYTMERADVAIPGQFQSTFMLADMLRFLATKQLVPLRADKTANHERFTDHAYLATHIGYVLQDYGRLELTPAQFGPAYDYIRAQFAPTLALPDLELVAEYVNLFRSMGFSDDDRMVCEGTRFLLAHQRPDGTFSDWAKAKEAYGGVHPTWVAVNALRDRGFQHDTPFAHRLTQILGRLHATK